MRGGVTVRGQDLTRLPLDVFGQIREMHPLLTPKLTSATIGRAVKEYCHNSNPRAKREVIRLFGKIENWDVSNVTNMSSLFANAPSFNQPLNKWNVSNVISMEGMFHEARSFNQPLNNWNVSNVTDMSYMFYGAESFNQPLNNWNVSNVTDMSYMFDGARSFNQPLNNWEHIGHVPFPTDIWGMFDGASSFNQPLHAPWSIGT